MHTNFSFNSQTNNKNWAHLISYKQINFLCYFLHIISNKRGKNIFVQQSVPFLIQKTFVKIFFNLKEE